MNPYKLVLHRKDKNPEELTVVAHYFPADVQGFLALVFEDHSMVLVSLKELTQVDIPPEVHYMNAQRSPSESKK